jgi:hypothetical protein
MDHKRIAILGTSNSIMRAGWASFFKTIAPKNWVIDNLSLGGNCAIFMPGQCDAYSVASNYDICIIELPINDQRYIDTGHFRNEYFAATIAGLLAKLTARDGKCIPVVLSLPKRSDMAAPSYFGSCETILSRVCAAFGVRLFDVGASIRAASFTTQRKTDDFFSDQLHLLPSVQRHVASAVLRLIDGGLGRPAGASDKFGALVPHFRTVMVSNIVPADRLSRRETSLSGFDVVRLEVGEELSIPARGFFCGILHWADQSVGEIQVSSGGQRSVRKLLRKEWPGGIFFFTHLQHAMFCNDKILLSSESGKNCALEPSINSSRNSPEGTPINEIAYAVFCDEDPDQSGRDLLEAMVSEPSMGMMSFDPMLTNQLRVIPLS